MPASSSKDPYLLKGFDWIILALRRTVATTFLFRGVSGFGGWAKCRLFRELGSIHPCSRNLHLPSESSAPRSRGTRSGSIGRGSGLCALNWTLTRPQGSKSGAWGKNWVQHREIQISCPGVGRKPALTSRRKTGYRSKTIRVCQKQTQYKEQSALECPKKPR